MYMAGKVWIVGNVIQKLKKLQLITVLLFIVQDVKAKFVTLLLKLFQQRDEQTWKYHL